MHFQALSVGIRVPTHHFNGTVHSVFHQACNVRLESHALLTLLPSEKDNVPHGIRLNILSQPAFRDLIRVGQSAACRGGILRIGGSDFSVDLRPASPWHIDLKGLRIDLCRPTRARCWAVAWSELKLHCHKHGMSENLGTSFLSAGRLARSGGTEILLQESASTIPLLLQATGRLRLREAIISMRALIGLGCGLTPSGDDFLVGYLAGLWCTARTVPSRMRFLLALGSELSQASRNTNEISGAYLRSAAKGHVSEPIAKLAQQLSQANSMNSVRTVTRAALQVGHTSGSDGVLGMLLGCLAWQGLPPHLIFNDLLRLPVLRN